MAALVLVDSALPFVLARPDPAVATIFVLNGMPGLGGLLRSLRRDTPPEVQVGRLKLYLLDTNDAANAPVHRGITSELYGGGPELRLQQEIVLGIGGSATTDGGAGAGAGACDGAG